MTPLTQEEFNFDKYLSPDPNSGIANDQPQNNLEVSFNFDQYAEKEPPSKLEEFKRHAARIGSRIGETIGGFPGDMVNFVKFLGEKLPETPEFLKQKPTFMQKAGRKALESLPTSQELKDFSSFITSGFTDPKNAQEELGDEIVSLGTSLLIPSKDPLKFKSLVKAIGLASASKTAGKGVEALGGGATAQAATEVGTLFLTGLLSKKTVDSFVSDQFQQARSKIPANTMVPTKRLASSLETLEKDLSIGISTPTKNEVKKAVEELRIKASSDYMPANELVEAYHNINERYTSKKLFDELSTSERKILKHRYDKFKTEVGKEISDYGKYNPDFYNQWKSANNAYGTIAQSKKVTNFLESNLGKMPKYLTSSVAVELFLGHPHIAAGTVAGAASVKMGELLYRIAKSPKLREHYLNVIKEAGNENLPAVIKNISAIQKETEKNNQSSK